MGGPPPTGVTAPSWGSPCVAVTASPGVFKCTRCPFGGAFPLRVAAVRCASGLTEGLTLVWCPLCRSPPSGQGPGRAPARWLRGHGSPLRWLCLLTAPVARFCVCRSKRPDCGAVVLRPSSSDGPSCGTRLVTGPAGRSPEPSGASVSPLSTRPLHVHVMDTLSGSAVLAVLLGERQLPFAASVLPPVLPGRGYPTGGGNAQLLH